MNIDPENKIALQIAVKALNAAKKEAKNTKSFEDLGHDVIASMDTIVLEAKLLFISLVNEEYHGLPNKNNYN